MPHLAHLVARRLSVALALVTAAVPLAAQTQAPVPPVTRTIPSVVFEDLDPLFNVGLAKSKDRAYLLGPAKLIDACRALVGIR